MSSFTLEHAKHLADLAYSKRIGSKFRSSQDLLNILQAAETKFNLEMEAIEFNREFVDEGGRLEQLETQLDRFLHLWDRTDRRVTDDIGYFSVGGEIPDLAKIQERNHLICEALGFLRDGLKKAIEYRSFSGDNGRPQNHPGLKAFVRGLHDGWTRYFGLDVPFGRNFIGGIDDSDREPDSPAAKLVVHAARIINPDWTGRDCETAIKDVKHGLDVRVPKTT